MSEPIALLREPTAQEASRWHKTRESPLFERFDLIARFLVEESLAAGQKRSEPGFDLVATLPSGAKVRFTTRGEAIEIRSMPALVRETERTQAEKDGDVRHLAHLVEIAQVGTGFYVFSEEVFGFDPGGGCPACQVEFFEWQDMCVACDAPLHPPATAGREDEHDGRAKRVLDALLRRDLIELVGARSRTNVERAFAAFYAHGTAGPDVMLGMLVDLPDVAEVYCDEDTLYQLLCRVR